MPTLRKFQFPSQKAPLPSPQPRAVAAKGMTALLVATGLSGAALLGLSLFTLANNLANTLRPVVVIDSPPSPPANEPVHPSSATASNLPSSPPPPSPNVPPPSFAETFSPQAPVPPATSLPLAQLTSEAAESLELIAASEAAETERLAELEAKELAAKEEQARQEALAAQEREKKAAEQRAQQARDAEARAERDKALALRQEQSQRAKAAQQQAALAKKIASAPTITKRSTPRYPSAARKAGQEGTTRIVATIMPNGRVSAPRVSQSSGFPSLDSSALAAVKKWRFAPARNALGEAIAHQVTLPITFRIN